MSKKSTHFCSALTEEQVLVQVFAYKLQALIVLVMDIVVLGTVIRVKDY